VFTDIPLAGNPVAIFTDGDGVSPALMQRAARELNLSETVFVLSAQQDGVDARIRIFTPVTELPFAGHPTLGAAFVVGERDGRRLVRLHTAAGVVAVRLMREGEQVVWGEMEPPIPTVEPFDRAPELLRALDVERSQIPVEAYRSGPLHVFVMLESEQAVRRLRPNVAALADLGELGVSCFSGSGRVFKTRMFAPALGVVEDPATGSAAGPLALHLARHEQTGFGEWIELHQGEEIGRPSLLRARVDGSPEHVERVLVAGAAVSVAAGEYRLS
jgi:trans-2,3-dihydro-3-hydroxyanthranilate isomerase